MQTLLRPDGRCGTVTHDHKRNGITTLFTALNALDGTIIGRNMRRHQHQELSRFPNVIEPQVPVGKVVHIILDKYTVHKYLKIMTWLERHPRFVFSLHADLLLLALRRRDTAGSKPGDLARWRPMIP